MPGDRFPSSIPIPEQGSHPGRGKLRKPDYTVDPETGCWLWAKGMSSTGYGRISGKPARLAHRVYWELENGPIRDGHHVHHKCERPTCVNPAHLEVLSVKEHIAKHAGTPHPVARIEGVSWNKYGGNWRARLGGTHLGTFDTEEEAAAERRRAEKERAETGKVTIRKRMHPCAKVTPEMCREIKARYAAGGITQPELAERYGVSALAIWRALQRELPEEAENAVA